MPYFNRCGERSVLIGASSVAAAGSTLGSMIGLDGLLDYLLISPPIGCNVDCGDAVMVGERFVAAVLCFCDGGSIGGGIGGRLRIARNRVLICRFRGSDECHPIGQMFERRFLPSTENRRRHAAVRLPGHGQQRAGLGMFVVDKCERGGQILHRRAAVCFAAQHGSIELKRLCAARLVAFCNGTVVDEHWLNFASENLYDVVRHIWPHGRRCTCGRRGRRNIFWRGST